MSQIRFDKLSAGHPFVADRPGQSGLFIKVRSSILLNGYVNALNVKTGAPTHISAHVMVLPVQIIAAEECRCGHHEEAAQQAEEIHR